MAYTSLVLTDPVSGNSFTFLAPGDSIVDGLVSMELDVQPSVRVVAEERVMNAGQVDNTLFLSAAAVTLTLRLYKGTLGAQPDAIYDQIGNLLGPSVRPNLIATNDQWGGVSRQLTVRFDSKTAPVDNSETRDVAISWKAPNGAWEASSPTVVTVPAFELATGGIAVTNPATGPGLGVGASPPGLPVTPSTVNGSLVTTVAGSLSVPWTANLYGPCSGPALANDSAGLAIVFQNTMVLGAGHFIAIDARKHTAFIDGDTSQNVLNQIDWTQTQWWLMQPGTNLLRYFPTSAQQGSVAAVTYQSAWMP